MPRNLLVGLIAALAAALGLALSLMLAQPKAVNLASGTLLQMPKLLPAFALTDESGAPYGNAQLQGHYTLLFTGFTTCPDICPATLSLLKTVVQKLGPEASKLQVLFLSVDPERDTPQRLKSYVHHFNPAFKGASGPTDELDKLALAMGFAYVKVPGATPETYTMDHSTALILLNPQGQVQAYFTAPHKAEALAADLLTLLKKKQ